jgi:hypothetical protein
MSVSCQLAKSSGIGSADMIHVTRPWWAVLMRMHIDIIILRRDFDDDVMYPEHYFSSGAMYPSRWAASAWSPGSAVVVLLAGMNAAGVNVEVLHKNFLLHAKSFSTSVSFHSKQWKIDLENAISRTGSTLYRG